MAKTAATMRPRRTRARRLTRALLAALLAVALLPTLASGVEAAVPSGPTAATVGVAARPAAPAIGASVTWDGTPVDHAASPSTAFPIRPGESPLVLFTFTEPAGSPQVTNASLVLLFLGLTLSSESLPPTGNASGVHTAALNWSFGSLYDLTEGVYELDAELRDRDGAVRFLEPFYVDARAPYVVGSAIAAFLLVLGGVEAYWVVAALQYRRRRRRGYRFR